jgi:hypothetical protein
MNMRTLIFLAAALWMWLPNGLGDIKVTFEHNSQSSATPAFQFKQVPQPSRNDAATTATLSIVEGQRDQNGGAADVLRDGQLPREEDEPGRNFFFGQGSAGGRIKIDLGRGVAIKEINSYSWHPADRGPQVYKLYASDGVAKDFNSEPKGGIDPATCGWKLVANVDTRPSEGAVGGQYGVRIADVDAERDLGPYRYLLFDISRTESRDPFGNTFFSEIDVVDRTVPPVAAASTNEQTKPITNSFVAEGGRYQFTLDTTVAPDLTEWATNQLRPVVEEWYPKLVALLPSEGFVARSNVTIRFRDNMGPPASAGGGFINCNAGWFRRELKREARGSVVHEMVHVVQSYGRVRRDNPEATRMPGWLVEGIPDYIRWFLYEPQTKGAEITTNNFARAKYDASYRITGNFLNWVTGKYDTNIVQKLNAAARASKYREELWKEYTGRTVQELGEEWKNFHQQRLGIKSVDKTAEAPKP